MKKRGKPPAYRTPGWFKGKTANPKKKVKND